MNRRKHPEKPFRRKPNTGDKTRGGTLYRVTASWDARPDRPAVRTTPDKRARDRMADEFADTGGYVIVEEHRGHGHWRTTREIDGPARLDEQARLAREADRAARDRAAAQQREQRHDADYAMQASRNTVAAYVAATTEHDRLAALMRQPPAPRDQRARHTAGGR